MHETLKSHDALLLGLGKARRVDQAVLSLEHQRVAIHLEFVAPQAVHRDWNYEIRPRT